MASQGPELTIVDAVREQENLYMALYGEGGTGKTLTALKMALYLTDGDASKILVVDTDARRSRHYAPSTPGGKDGIPFKATYVDTYSPANFIAAFKTAGEQGIKCIIVDSMTHFWSGNGGLIEVNEKHGIKYFKGNTQAAWGKTNQVENKMHEAIDRFISEHGHVFLCFQQKQEYKAGTLDVVGVRAEGRYNWGHRFNVVGHMTLHRERENDKTSATVNRLTIEKSTITRLTVDGYVVNDDPIIPAGTYWDKPGPEAVRDIMAHLHAGSKGADYQMQLEAYLNVLQEENADRKRLLAELEAVSSKPWPGWLKNQAREAITAMGKALASASVADARFSHLETGSDSEDWTDAINACSTTKDVEGLVDHAKKCEVHQRYAAQLRAAWNALNQSADAEPADNTVSA